MQRKNPFKKSISFLLAVLMVLQCGHFVVQRTAAATSAEGSGSVILGNTSIAYTQKLTDNGNGTFTLELTLKDASSLSDANEDSTVSRNGYFTAPADGEYLVEIWGGNGAGGSDTGDGAPGEGGAGGHIYGVVTLEKGETLFYQLGGNGQQTITEGEGGGVNGDGAGGGDITTYTIGGGGGYSAVYKFAAGEFEDKYLDAEGNMTAENITEGDRTTKFILVAGGGGGGGASSLGEGGIFGLGLIGDKGNPPSGGAGGSMISQSYTLGNGTVYYGSNGLTSGSNPDYIGKGGTEKPGEVSTMWLTQGWFSGSVANDWFATVDTTLQGGAGGTGNGRGGSGGAGYCGGSGGVQTEIIVATNVGGGGGGSSFVANEVATPTEEQKEKLSGTHVSETGGAIFITALDAAVSAELGSGVDLTLDPTDYFDITVSGATLSEGVWHTEVGVVGSTVTIVFTPKTGFAGGNNVPLLDGNAIACASAATDSTSTCSIPLAADCAAVNVPLNFEAIGNSLISDTTERVFSPEELYSDTYGVDQGSGSIRDTLPAPNYAFIQSIGNYAVYRGDDVVSEDFKVTGTTTFRVMFEVTPKSGAAAVVGTPVAQTTFTDTAKITISSSGEKELNGNMVYYDKILTYDDVNNQYILTFTADIESKTSTTTYTVDQVNAELANANPKINEYTSTSSYTFTINHSGYYYIQSWGGDGGKGGDVQNDGGTSTGSAGGSGAYLGGFVYLKKNDKITIAAGGAGNSPDLVTGNKEGQGGGAGGTTTVVIEGGTALMAAGGGAGGGGAARYKGSIITIINNGQSCTEKGPDSTGFADSYSAAVGDTGIATGGTAGTIGDWFECIAGSPGRAGLSFLDTTLMGQQKAGFPLTADTTQYTSADHTGSSGAIHLTCLQVDNEADVQDAAALTGYYFNVRFDQYFDLVKIVGVDDNRNDGVLAMTVPVDLSAELIQITNINPESNTDDVVVTANFEIRFYLTPKAGFLGGNDVPILLKDAENTDAPNGMRLLQLEDGINIDVADEDASDYANVAIDYKALAEHISPGEENDGTDSDRTIDQSMGETSVSYSNLYTWENQPNLNVEDWQKKFVKLVETVVVTETGAATTDPLAPEVTTTYTVTVGLAPTETDPAEIGATVIDPVDPITVSKNIEVIVLPQVHYVLSNLTASDELHSGTGYEDGRTSIDPGVDHPITLTPVSGYILPDTITVTDTNGKDISGEVGYDPDTGKLTIPARYAFGTITVTAAATPKTYTVTYYYYTNPGGAMQTKKGGTYAAGETLKETLPIVGTVDGYTFTWDWGDGATVAPATMPGRNLIVIGTFKANEYDLTINYVYEDDTKAAEPYTAKVGYLAEYSVTSPLIEGYLADKVTVSGTMSLGGETVTVTYKATDNQLNIYYLYADGSEAADPFNGTYETNAPYSITSPAITGYTANQTVISGTMSAKGATYYVYYTPNRYTVTFDDGVGMTSRLVEYDNKYSYDVVANTYTALPTPAPRVGYNFTGWTDSEGHPITANDIVKSAKNHTLYAQWEAKQITVTIKYIDDEGNLLTFDGGPKNPLVVTGEYGSSQTYTSPSYPGYTPDQAEVSVDFTEDNKVIVVVYRAPKTYTLNIYYLYSGQTDPFHVYTKSGLKEGDSYSEDSPEVAGYTPTPAVVSGVMPNSDLVIKVYYTENAVERVISVTVEWGEMDFKYTYGQWDSDTHTYDPSEIDPSKNLGNRIIVTNSNDSTIPVYAALTYKAADVYDDIRGYFTDANAKNGVQTYGWALVPGDSGTAYLWLEGELDRGLAEPTITSGECIVTITGGS